MYRIDNIVKLSNEVKILQLKYANFGLNINLTRHKSILRLTATYRDKMDYRVIIKTPVDDRDIDTSTRLFKTAIHTQFDYLFKN